MHLKCLLFLPFLIITFSCQHERIIEIKSPTGQIIEKIYGDTTNGKNGRVELFDEKGILTEESYYSKGLLDGERKLFENGVLYSIETRVKDKFQGPFKSFFTNGNLKVEGQYENDITIGIWKSYYPSGKLKDEVTMAENEENGPFKEYYENGNTKAIGSFILGMNEQDTLFLFDTTGLLEKKMICNSGICQTLWKKDSLQ